ncbi:internalin N-terminal domain-containing protein [Listeria seeligeri]|uniref:internalin N-terminal domain-containing protein n=1 Tax=Listeria seeligeri TaxID=1640 RepID=UPI0015E771BD|nr:leucine-rich repeat domain-containing protein [Listeria seeligeri]MBF2665089.1 internalin N-terminal domain-containing protein [Listeria seeligeri]
MKKILKICLIMSVIIIGVVSFKTIDASANTKDVYPLPARIIDVFPSENLAEDMLFNLNKESVNDVITQEDIDSATSLGLGYEKNYLTDADLQLLENAYFTNVNNVMIYPTQTMFTSFPDLSTLPKLASIRAETSNQSASASITVPDYQNYPELTSIDFNQRIITGGLPDFSNIPKLETLELNDCGLTSADIPDFSNLKSLKEVGLQLNELETEMTDFTHLDSLESMNLSYNYLITLPPTILDDIVIVGQLGTLPNQTVGVGTNTNITLPIYTQLDEVGRISGFQEVRIVNSDKVTIYDELAVNYDETTKQIVVPTSTLAKGDYSIIIGFNGTAPYVSDGEILEYSVLVTIN